MTETTTENMNDLQYYLLSARNPRQEQIELHDQVFKFWLGIWKPTLAELNYPDSHLHEDFIRQDLVSCICHKGQVVGALLFSFYSLGPQAVMEFRYMKDNFNDLYFQKLKKFGVQSVMSMQYLAVHPDWRGRRNPHAPPIATLLTGLANKVRDLYNIDAGIAPARKDYDSGSSCLAVGGDRIIDSLISHNVDCYLIANIKGRTHDHTNLQIQNLVDRLWVNRVDSKKTEPTRHLEVA